MAGACGVPQFSGFKEGADQDGSSGGSGGLDGGDAGAGAKDGGIDGDAADAGCSSNAQCTTPGLSVCDTASGTCVECVPSNDTCPSGTYCASDNKCTVGCKTDADCVPAPQPDAGTDAAIVEQDSGAGGTAGAAGSGGGGPVSDAGPSDSGSVTLKCDLTKHLCTGCVEDANCPIGTICDVANQTCIPGCLSSATCPTGFDCCEKQCANTQTSAEHCGACGSECKPLNGTGACEGGQCKVGTCDAGFGDCDQDGTNGCESVLATDPLNCGACGTPCAPGPNAQALCEGSACKLGPCLAGFANCDGQDSSGCEIDLTTNASNCGKCGVVCDLLNANEVCSNGSCAVGTCTAGYGDCDKTASTGCETNTQTDDQNCGICGTTCQFPNAGANCVAGKCGIASCIAPFQNCDAATANGCESNKTTDVNNCGTCGNACLLNKANPKCDNGSCAIASCQTGYGDCNGADADGCEINLTTSILNCGACNNVCGTNNATATCNGTCVLTCNAGFKNCDGVAANGCEVNTTNNVNHCGACGVKCTAPVGSTPNCVNSTCGISSCTAPLADCNGLPGDGCEVNTSSNVTHCGTCGNACFVSNGSPGCTNGNCTVAGCNTGFGNCDGIYLNGCEKNLKTDPLNCNGCNIVCNSTNGTASCNNGACAITCNNGFANCNGLLTDGCETPTNTVSNCGGCGVQCNNGHGTTSCNGTACAPVCAAGWGDCNGNKNDGCETPLNTLTDCGSCGTSCALANGGETCTTGTCQVTTCDPGFGNCDGTASNGCEVNLNTTVGHCGTCGAACSTYGGTASCSAGNCNIVCNSPYQNCDLNARTNGCEANTSNDPQHCGNCTTTCAANQNCVNGTCQVAGCPANTANCDGQSGNGCECQTPSCCGNNCQIKHCNGVGQYWYDCVARGTYNSVQAYQACEAFGGVGTCNGFTCGSGTPNEGQVVCSNNGVDCICFGFTGTITGKWFNGNGKQCWCPLPQDPTWDPQTCN